MDLHQIGTGLDIGSGSYAQQEQQQQSSTTSTTPSSSVSPSTRQRPQHFQQHQHQHQLYNLLPLAPQPHGSYSSSISSLPRSKDLLHQHQQQQQYQPQQLNIKREIMGKHLDTGNGSKNEDDPMPSTSDFVKKLYKMLEDPSFQNVVSWGPLGDCFVVKDMNDFTKSILPRMFKHSNFASFVRQLNKYDFHKVKNTDDNIFGEHSWTFRHPDFHADRREALENIKRKVPAQRKSTNVPNSTTTSMSSSTNNNNIPSSPSMQHNPHSHSHHTTTSSPYRRRSPSPTYSISNPNPFYLKQEISELKSRIVNLESSYETRLNNLETNYESRLRTIESELESRLRGLEMGYEGRMRGLEKNYESVLVELVGFQRGAAQQDGVVKSLIRCFLGEDNEQKTTSATVNRNLTTTSTAGLLLPIASASTSGKLEDGPGHYQHRNRTPSLPFSQSQTQSQSQLLVSPQTLPQGQLPSQKYQSQPASEAPSHSDFSLFLPQDTVQRVLGTTSTISPTTTTGDGNVRWGNRHESGDSGVEFHHDHSQSQGPSRQQKKLSRREALAQILEYHRERSLGGKDGTDADGDECRGRDGDGDEDERGKRKRRESDVELDKHGVGKAYTPSSTTRSTQQQQTFSHPPASLTSACSSTSTSSVTWSSTTMTNNNNGTSNNAFSFVPSGEDDDSPSPSSSSLMTNGLQLYTVGHLMQNGSSGGASANGSQVLGNFMYEPTAAASETLGPQVEDGNEDDEEVEIVPPGMLTTGPPPSTPTIFSTTETPPPSLASLLPPSSQSSSSSSQQKLRVRGATFVPGSWAVSPRVLLVDDDAVIRKLSSRFLKIFGCTTDVAVDGIGAVTKMNLEKYDLVLMDILMPKLDGITATNLIRKFDRGTPIISMTANSKPNEIMEYYSSGMNDILPKPFTKEGLLDMLEKHLMHLKVMQQMTVIPRSVGVPPLSDANFEQVLMTNAMTMVEQQQQRHSAMGLAGLLVSESNTADGLSTTNTLFSPIPLTQQQQQQQQLVPQQPSQISFTSLLGMGEDVRINNPLAGMGLSDEHYGMILQNLVNGERFTGMGMDGVVGGGGSGSGSGGSGGVNGGIKRTIDDVGFGSDKREGKRSRFEVIE